MSGGRCWIQIATVYPYGSNMPVDLHNAFRVLEALKRLGHEVKTEAENLTLRFYARRIK